jgi:ABC-type polysaccharide/polyol phosphate transport system ATPase subunit
MMGIHQYNDMEQGKEKFRKLERKKVEQIVNWDQYGMYGFRLYFMPGPISTLFFNSGHFTELTCHIDSGEKLTIYGLFKGKKIFEEKPGKLMDFSGIILILGSFITLFYGFDAFRHREYIKFLASVYGHGKTFFFIWLSRVILLSIYFVFVTLVSTLCLIINHIQIKGSDLVYLWVFFWVILMMQVFFFTVGTIASRLKSRMMAGVLIAFSWILFVYIIPATLNKVVEAKARNIESIYQWELDKLTILMGFEKEVKKEVAKVKDVEKQYYMVSVLYNEVDKTKIKTPGDFWKWIDAQKKRKAITQGELKILEEIEERRGNNLPIEELRKFTVEILKILYRRSPSQIKADMAHRYLKKEFPQIQKKENELLGKMKSEIDFFQGLFSIFPTTFYLSTGNEISSRGYANIIKFYENSIGIKKRFMKFYVDHRYGDNPDKIVNFIEEFKEKEKEKGEKEANIYKATTRLPGKFGFGIGVTLSWILVVLLFSYLSYKRALFRPPKKQIIGLNDLEIDLVKGRSDVMLSSEKDIGNHLYNVLSGKNRVFKGAVKWRDDDIAAKNIKVNFVYLCHIEEMPGDIKAKNFVLFIGKGLKTSKERMQSISRKLGLNKIGRMSFGQLSDRKKAQILLEAACLKTCDIYMINNYLKGMPSDFAEEFKNRMEELRGRNASILYVTNDVFMGRRLGDRLTFLKTEAALASVKW